ncbi:hypothetical protein BVY00_01355 [bacterium G20]|nr:hypothetical protein BVY00_01355 [bacterium G20]
MQDHHSAFIVLEGSDGSGKGTQFRLLTERLKAVGHEVAVFDFPRYKHSSSYFVKRYLNGDYGPASEISPYTASIFYALDRYEASPQIREALRAGKIVLANRYVGSNMAHQGAKFGSLAEQRGFFMWADSTEYQLLGIPRPTINLFLKVPPEISKQLINERADKISVALDEHEKNIEHLRKAVAAYDLLCQLFPRDFKEIDCVLDNKMRGIIEINDLIWETIKPLLPEPSRKGRNIVLNLDQPTNLNGSKSEQKTPEPGPRLIIKTKPPKNEGAVKLENILDLQKQMLAKSRLLKTINQRQLKNAIGLVTPLAYRRSEFKELLEERSALKTSPDDEPVSVNEIIEQLAGRVPISANDEPIKLLAANPRC